MQQLTLAMLVLSRRFLIVFIWGSLAPATVETFVSNVCPCPLFDFIIVRHQAPIFLLHAIRQLDSSHHAANF